MEPSKMANCPQCQKPVLCAGHFTSFTEFNIKCPWCQTALKITIQPKIITEAIKLNAAGSGEAREKTTYPLSLKKVNLDPENLFKALGVVMAVLLAAF